MMHEKGAEFAAFIRFVVIERDYGTKKRERLI
jgi:hypothetical protein